MQRSKQEFEIIEPQIQICTNAKDSQTFNLVNPKTRCMCQTTSSQDTMIPKHSQHDCFKRVTLIQKQRPDGRPRCKAEEDDAWRQTEKTFAGAQLSRNLSKSCSKVELDCYETASFLQAAAPEPRRMQRRNDRTNVPPHGSRPSISRPNHSTKLHWYVLMLAIAKKRLAAGKQ